ncbi:MAG: hypothetical protein HY902_15245 [Deltaproteobacteria bacterium]|nr:hypothetical protein [Deltaproteobacteria bacterium]
MNTKIFHLVILLLVAVVACKSPSPVPVGTPDATGQDSGEVSAGPDSSAQDVAPADDVGVDADGDASELADADTEPSDVLNDSADVLPQDATATDFCAELDLPKPGEPCPIEGDVNCTNWGASSVKKSAPYNHGYCRRPYKVVCGKAAAGLQWQLQECDQPPDECKDPGYFSTCQVNSRGAKCCPRAFVASAEGSTDKYFLGEICGESPADLATTWCNGNPFGYPAKCAFPDVVIAEAPTSSTANMAKIQSKCIAWCKDCVYSMGAAQICPTFTALGCGFAKEPYELVTQAHTFCLTDKIPGKPGPQCATSCADVMLTDWYKQNYGPK